MLSFKRFLCIVLFVAALGSVFLIYNKYENQPVSVQSQNDLGSKREFIEAVDINEEKKPRVWLFGNSADKHYGNIYNNVKQFCRDIHLTVSEVKHLDTDKIEAQDLVIFCDTSFNRYAGFDKLEKYIAEGGRVILAAGIAEGDKDARLWSVLDIQKKTDMEDCHDLAFEKPLLPIQPKQAYFDGNSGSVQITVGSDADVYIRNAEDDVPILYTNTWKNGSVCLINGTFLTDIRYMGLLSGTISALIPDFVYPVLGVKTVFVDNIPKITSDDDELCRKLYGYSAEGFVQNEVWPALQGISVRTDTPYTSGILAVASSEESFNDVDDALFISLGKSVLQFDGELVYTANCSEKGKVAFNESLIDRFSAIFPNYTVHGLAMENDNFDSKMLDIPDASIQSVRGKLDSRDMHFSSENGYTVFPLISKGNTMEDGNLFTIYSAIGSYGMVSHAFDVKMFISKDEDTTAWDLDKRQISLFESDILAKALWLEGRTLTRTADDVKSYCDLNYTWVKNGNSIELDCSNAVKGQAFYYHTDNRIADAKGVTYQDIGNGYYLLRVQDNHGIIILEEKE